MGGGRVFLSAFGGVPKMGFRVSGSCGNVREHIDVVKGISYYGPGSFIQTAIQNPKNFDTDPTSAHTLHVGILENCFVELLNAGLGVLGLGARCLPVAFSEPRLPEQAERAVMLACDLDS